MDWKFDNNTPVYLQIADIVRLAVISGQLNAGDKLPGVREIAAESGVNPNTVQRGLGVLEAENMLEVRSTVGRYITESHELIDAARVKAYKQRALAYLNDMKALGARTGEAFKYLKLAEENDNE